MKDIRNAKVDLRLTQQEKEKLKEWAAARNISVGEAIRRLCESVFQEVK